jgi:CubicO group peptidase (beta-lactamase class C family)
MRKGLPSGSRGGTNGGVKKTISIALLALATPVSAQQIRPSSPQPYTHAIAAGYKAITLCEGIFTAGRTEAQIAATELRGIYPEYDAIVPTLTATIDRQTRVVTVPFDARLAPRRAMWRPRYGCYLSPISTSQAHANPAVATPSPLPADPRPWPMGDASIAPRPSPALAGLVARAFDRASFGAESVTTGVVIVKDGRIVAEQYAPGFGPMVPNRTWSVAKSIAGTLVGITSLSAKIDPAKPATIPEWRRPGDPRAAITLDNLMRMASGLHSDTAGNRTDAIYFGGTTVTEQATGWPLEAAPGVRFRYANNDILLATRSLRATLGEPRYAALPHDGLFAPLGMTHSTTGTDWQGNYILSSQVWTTARDLARLGQFWLQDGVWQGRRLLPAGWMHYLTTPSGPQPVDGPGYGATMWLFGAQQGLPADSYAAQGNRGQSVMVIPQHRLVIVRRGEDPGPARFDIARFSAEVIAATP